MGDLESDADSRRRTRFRAVTMKMTKTKTTKTTEGDNVESVAATQGDTKLAAVALGHWNHSVYDDDLAKTMDLANVAVNPTLDWGGNERLWRLYLTTWP